MKTSKFIFTQFKSRYVVGSCLFGTNGIIKMYVSQTMAEKTVAKIQEAGIKCKAVKNYTSWAIVAD